MVQAALPTILTVIITAAIDSINPCAIGVLVLMMSVVLAGGQSVRRMVFLGFVYIFGIFLVYLVAGLGFVYLFAHIPLYVTEYLSIAVAILIIIAGIIEVKDFFWYGEGFSLMIPPIFAKKLQNFASNTTVWGVFLLGMFVSGVELPCTGAPYLAIITILSQYFDFTAFLLLVLYNLIFVLPLIVILFLVAGGKKLQDVKAWKQANKANMRLFTGLLLIALAWLLILIANGTINFG
jgi:cytochrome c biogenesis protein CcdA